MTAPEAAVRARISAEGAIPFADFMEAALYGEDGYYRQQSFPIGPAGDFVTGSSFSPLFAGATLPVTVRFSDASGLPEALASKRARDRMVAYVCRGPQCSEPIGEIARLLA